MNVQQAIVGCRTLVVEGRDGIARNALLAELARQGFLIRRPPEDLHHVDPTQPYRELLAAPGLLAVDGSMIRELVYGPLRRGRSRVTWIQALDFAEAVAERDGAILHLVAPASAPECGLPGRVAPGVAEAAAVEEITAYERAFRTLAQHVPVVTVDIREVGHPIRAPVLRRSQRWLKARKLTVG
ncbi:hypothetical protein [Streptomyces sp. NPDC020681]|uniref:hypothetical protein n=1 Tax=Streptomyces sp. NPDC020681 TaxID=3365083 RepID=UPI0037B88406